MEVLRVTGVMGVLIFLFLAAWMDARTTRIPNGLLLAGIPRQKIRLAEDEFAALELLPLTPGDDVYLLYGVDGTPLAFRVREKLKEKLLAKIPSADLSGDKKSWLKDPIRDSAGSVETVEVGGVTVRGGTVRAALGLRSACFEWELQDGNFAFYVTGYGHGVGLSQYGADAMAESGADYQTILTHYYTGVTVEVFNG